MSNVDATDFVEATRDLDPAETLFIVSSKTFTTLETMTNARIGAGLVRGRARRRGRRRPALRRGLDERERRREFGIDTENMFGFWDWVGGRYSMDSAIGLSTMLAVGPEHFREMLAGFHAMDEHFRTAPLGANLPLLMGLLAVWYRNFFGAQTVGGHALRAVPEALSRLPAAADDGVQRQARHARRRAASAADTGAVYWGEPGTNGQHSFYQLIHQGTTVIPVDLIGFARTPNPLRDHHDLLSANVFAQAKALAFGRTEAEVRAEGTAEARGAAPGDGGQPPDERDPHRRDQPVPARDARRALRAQRVHAGHDLGIDSFDQWGVELGKVLAQQIAPQLESDRRARPRPRLLHERADPPVPPAQAATRRVRGDDASQRNRTPAGARRSARHLRDHREPREGDDVPLALQARGAPPARLPDHRVAVDDWSADQLRAHARSCIADTGETIDEEVFARFASRLDYVSGDFGDDATYESNTMS